MIQRFAEKVALVTGGGSGIGRSVATAFAQEGAAVVVAGRSPGPLEATVRMIEDKGGRAAAVTADVTRAADVSALVDSVVERFGGLHLALNNAGTLAPGPVAELTESVWDAALATNLTGTWLSMKHEIRHMRAHGGGVIVNVSSAIGPHMRRPGTGAYAASKAGVSALTRTAALECIRDGVRINAVSPGPVDTPMSRAPGEDDAARDARLKEALPIGRVGTLEEVAATVLWLASEEAGFIVGQDVVLDGGGTA